MTYAHTLFTTSFISLCSSHTAHYSHAIYTMLHILCSMPQATVTGLFLLPSVPISLPTVPKCHTSLCIIYFPYLTLCSFSSLHTSLSVLDSTYQILHSPRSPIRSVCLTLYSVLLHPTSFYVFSSPSLALVTWFPSVLLSSLSPLCALQTLHSIPHSSFTPFSSHASSSLLCIPHFMLHTLYPTHHTLLCILHSPHSGLSTSFYSNSVLIHQVLPFSLYFHSMHCSHPVRPILQSLFSVPPPLSSLLPSHCIPTSHTALSHLLLQSLYLLLHH